jgi:hypothetical protein
VPAEVGWPPEEVPGMFGPAYSRLEEAFGEERTVGYSEVVVEQVESAMVAGQAELPAVHPAGHTQGAVG